MYWIVTASGVGGEHSRIGVGSLPYSNAGPARGSSLREKAAWITNYLSSHGSMFPYGWQTFDEDGYLVYSGSCGDITNADQDQAFAPLDFSEADCGATTMKYRKVGGSKWETL